MITEFTLKVYGDTYHQANDEMGSTTSAMLVLMRLFTGSEIAWECIEDVIAPDPAWVPGLGPKGSIRGYKAYRRFQPCDKDGGGEIMEPTPDAPEEAPVEEIVDDPTPETPEAPEEETPAEEEEAKDE